MQLDQALLLAAGEGSRLRPLTDHVPKPLLPIDGRAVIATLLHELQEAGVVRAVVVVAPAATMLRDYLAELASPQLAIELVEQPDAIGTADAIQRGLPLLRRDAPALLAACDTVWQQGDVHRIAQDHLRTGSLVTMAARRWPLEQLPHRSCLALDDEGRVLRVIEKPRTEEITSALSGSPLYAMTPGFWSYVERVVPSPSGKLELASALQAAIDDGHRIQSLEVEDTRDLTRPSDLLRHNFPYLAARLPELP